MPDQIGQIAEALESIAQRARETSEALESMRTDLKQQQGAIEEIGGGPQKVMEESLHTAEEAYSKAMEALQEVAKEAFDYAARLRETK